MNRRMPGARFSEFAIETLIRVLGFSTIGFVLLIFLFLLREGVPLFLEVPLKGIFSSHWYPTFGIFGTLPLILGSVLVTLFSIIIALPLGVATAVFVREVAPRWMRDILKPIIEVLAGIPSVVLGFFGMTFVAPFVRILGAPTGLTAFTGALILAYMALPTIISVAEDALDSVPRSYRDAGLAMGATRWQTMWRVVVPAARSGILTAVMLGMGRAIGETMAVMMVTGQCRGHAGLPRRAVQTDTNDDLHHCRGDGRGGPGGHALPRAFRDRDHPFRADVPHQPRRRVRHLPEEEAGGPAMIDRSLVQRLGFGLLGLITLVVVVPILLVIGVIVARGISAINWQFLTTMPHGGMRQGGILPAIVGTLLLTMGTALVAVPIGVGGAVYLSEYARDTRLTRSIRLAIVNLAGIPSIVYGLFGLGMFVLFFRFGTSILAGSLTLAIMTLPVIISTAEEALRAVPQEFRIVSESLGGTRWQGIKNIVLPQALPGIITGVILGLLRAAGETAPILFTVAAFYLPRLPTSPLDQTMALPYHLYVISTQVPGMPLSVQYGTALVLLALVLSLNIVASVMRRHFRRKRQW